MVTPETERGDCPLILTIGFFRFGERNSRKRERDRRKKRERTENQETACRRWPIIGYRRERQKRRIEEGKITERGNGSAAFKEREKSGGVRVFFFNRVRFSRGSGLGSGYEIWVENSWTDQLGRIMWCMGRDPVTIY